MITAADPAGPSRTTRTLLAQALLPRERLPLTGAAERLAADLEQVLRFARGAMMRARPIGSPNWCSPPARKPVPFAWPAHIRLDGEGLYHPAYDTERRYCSSCHPKCADWVGEPVDPATVPQSLRCPEDNRYWPNTVRRPRNGPLTQAWTAPGNVPRWYVWWRLWGVQDGHCATCPGPPQVIDHNHTTGLLRGLLCYDCNTAEALCARGLALHQHSGRCRFQAYWDSPPGAPFGWYWPDPGRQGGIQAFLPGPPDWARTRPPKKITCSPHCLTWILHRRRPPKETGPLGLPAPCR
ncbi:endonuclease domain-containing protein [Streptomyces sp. bgisy126]|uniref:endonuclease domain-containing protein n=1 Tax=unclassified Streptomyces TaxID=2593676 RepID=UPI003EBCF235